MDKTSYFFTFQCGIYHPGGGDERVLPDRDVLPDHRLPDGEDLLRLLPEPVDHLARLRVGRRAELAAGDEEVEEDLRGLGPRELASRRVHRERRLRRVEDGLAVLLGDVERDRGEGSGLADRLLPGALGERDERVGPLRQRREEPGLVVAVVIPEKLFERELAFRALSARKRPRPKKRPPLKMCLLL